MTECRREVWHIIGAQERFLFCLFSSFISMRGLVSRTGSCPYESAQDGQAWTPGLTGGGCRVGILSQGHGSRGDLSMLSRYLKSCHGWEVVPEGTPGTKGLRRDDLEADSQRGSGLLVDGRMLK